MDIGDLTLAGEPTAAGQQLNQYLLDPAGTPAVNAITDTLVTEGYTNQSPDFQWNWYQHCPTMMPNGDLAIV